MSIRHIKKRMKKILHIILLLLLPAMIYSSNDKNDLKVLQKELYGCFSSKNPPLGLSYKGGFLRKGTTVEITNGTDTVKVLASNGLIVYRKILFRGETINLYRFSLDAYSRPGQCGIYDPAKNVSFKKKGIAPNV